MLVNDLYTYLGGRTDPNHGVSYGLSKGNTYSLYSTPNLWGRNPAIFDYAHCSQNLREGIAELISSAQHTVDISTLSPLPNDGLFLDSIKRGLHKAASNNPRLVMRVLEGTEKTGWTERHKKIPEWIDAVAVPSSVSLYVGAAHPEWFSWNHSKLVIVDGQKALCGGHNLWSDTYCEFAPIHDVSIILSGPAVAVAQNFLNLQWAELAKYSRTKDPTKWAWSQAYINGKVVSNALPAILQAPAQPISGGAKVLALGRVSVGAIQPGPSANASRTARVEAVRRAEHSVKFSQMMLAGSLSGNKYDDELMDALAGRIVKDVEVTIIISDTGAESASGGAAYSGFGVEKTARELRRRVALITKEAGQALAKRMAAKAHVGPVRQYPKQSGDPEAESWKWRYGDKVHEPGNHAKVYIIDDSSFYVGSDNAYPIFMNPEGLQEFGFMVGGEPETKRFLDDYWNKFWSYSSQFQFDWHRNA